MKAKVSVENITGNGMKETIVKNLYKFICCYFWDGGDIDVMN